MIVMWLGIFLVLVVQNPVSKEQATRIGQSDLLINYWLRFFCCFAAQVLSKEFFVNNGNQTYQRKSSLRPLWVLSQKCWSQKQRTLPNGLVWTCFGDGQCLRLKFWGNVKKKQVLMSVVRCPFERRQDCHPKEILRPPSAVQRMQRASSSSVFRFRSFEFCQKRMRTNSTTKNIHEFTSQSALRKNKNKPKQHKTNKTKHLHRDHDWASCVRFRDIFSFAVGGKKLLENCLWSSTQTKLEKWERVFCLNTTQVHAVKERCRTIIHIAVTALFVSLQASFHFW